jgi:hypothetical protein
MSEIQRIIDSIPEEEFLGVMATEINPRNPRTCLVCRLVSPDELYVWSAEKLVPARAAADRLGLPRCDMYFLYYAASDDTAEVEVAIANRLNRIVDV